MIEPHPNCRCVLDPMPEPELPLLARTCPYCFLHWMMRGYQLMDEARRRHLTASTWTEREIVGYLLRGFHDGGHDPAKELPR